MAGWSDGLSSSSAPWSACFGVARRLRHRRRPGGCPNLQKEAAVYLAFLILQVGAPYLPTCAWLAWRRALPWLARNEFGWGTAPAPKLTCRGGQSCLANWG